MSYLSYYWWLVQCAVDRREMSWVFNCNLSFFLFIYFLSQRWGFFKLRPQLLDLCAFLFRSYLLICGYLLVSFIFKHAKHSCLWKIMKTHHLTLRFLLHISIVCPYSPGVSYFTFTTEKQCPGFNHFAFYWNFHYC